MYPDTGKRKEVAKLFAGFAANQAVTHGALPLSGVQFALFGVQNTRGLNSVAAVVWAVVLAVLAIFGWSKK